MKKLLFPSILLLFLACSNDKDKSDAYGNFETDEVTVSAETGGRILRFDIREGMTVDSGYLAGLIDTTEIFLRTKQLLAQKNVIFSKTESIRAQSEIYKQQKKNLLTDQTRIGNLLEKNAATRKQLDDINGNLEVLDRQTESVLSQLTSLVKEMESVDVQIEQAALQRQKCELRCPVRGMVLEDYARQGEVTAFGKPVFKIGKTDKMYLKVYVSARQLSDLRTGQQVEVLTDSHDGLRKYPGTVTWISDNAEFTPKIIQTREERVNLVYAVKILVANDGTIRIGMPGEARFTSPENGSF